MVGNEGNHNNMQELASMGWMDAINSGFCLETICPSCMLLQFN
jgi:hypothetical protein